MNIINIDRLKLISILEENKLAHIKEYELAIERWEKEVRYTLDVFFDEMSNLANDSEYDKTITKYQEKEGNFSLNHFVSDYCEMKKLKVLPKPLNQSNKYDKFIRQLHLSVDSVIALDEKDYDCYVEDQWDWAVTSKMLNSRYL